VLSVGTEEMSAAAVSPPAVDRQRSGTSDQLEDSVNPMSTSTEMEQPAAIPLALSGIFSLLFFSYLIINKANHLASNLHVEGEAATLLPSGPAIVEPIVNLIPPTPEKLEAAFAASSSLAPPIPQLRLNTRSRSKTRSPSPGIQLDVPTEVQPLRRSSRSRSPTFKTIISN
jgi:hypothetical protein